MDNTFLKHSRSSEFMDNISKIDEKSYYQKCEKYINRIQKYKQALEKNVTKVCVIQLSNCFVIFAIIISITTAQDSSCTRYYLCIVTKLLPKLRITSRPSRYLTYSVRGDKREERCFTKEKYYG